MTNLNLNIYKSKNTENNSMFQLQEWEKLSKLQPKLQLNLVKTYTGTTYDGEILFDWNALRH